MPLRAKGRSGVECVWHYCVAHRARTDDRPYKEQPRVIRIGQSTLALQNAGGAGQGRGRSAAIITPEVGRTARRSLTLRFDHTMTSENETPDHDRVPTWAALGAVALGALLLGFAAGWFLRGDGGEATALMAASANQVAPAETSGAPIDPPAQTEPTPAATAKPRAEVDVTVLNGSGREGLAGQVSGQLLDTGYGIASADNGPPTPGPSIVYFIAGRRAEAVRLRKDLQLSSPVQPLPDGPVRDIAPESAQLVVLLGSG